MTKEKPTQVSPSDAERKRTLLFDTSDWLLTILAHPELENICPWELFDHRERFGLLPHKPVKPWLEILLRHPRMIKYAPVPFPAEYLDACDWAKILLLHPALGSKVPWENLKWHGHKEIRLAWMKLLVSFPKFAKYCHWPIFYSHTGENNPNEWIKLLQLRPEFIKYYLKLSQEQPEDSGITLITPCEWAEIISIRPELLDYAPKKHFTNEDWGKIIAKQPHLCPKRMKKKGSQPDKGC